MWKKKLFLFFLGGLVVGLFGGFFIRKAIQPRSALAQIYRNPELYHEDTTNKAPIVLRWEELGGNINRIILRARVPGGWLVSQEHGLAFVPDPNDAWR